MRRARPVLASLLLAAGLAVAPARAADFPPEVMESVVSLLPVWPGLEPGSDGIVPEEPEGTAVAVASGGYLATALHVVDRASEIAVRLPDGRLVQAELIGRDPPTDIALLKVEADLPPLDFAATPPLAAEVCAVGNQFGLGLSVSCGVVSAVHRSGIGFNPVEDFIQTDAVVNPGASGGALVDGQGRLVGLLSAIFTKQSDADIGVNFAVSADLLRRVVVDLMAGGRVVRPRSGLRVADLERTDLFIAAGARVIGVQEESAAAEAGLMEGDLVTAIDGRPIRRASDVTAAVQLRAPGESLAIEVLRDGETRSLTLTLPGS